MVLRKSRRLGERHSSKPLPQDTIAPAKIIFCVESEKNMEYNPINALKMKSLSGYTQKNFVDKNKNMVYTSNIRRCLI